MRNEAAIQEVYRIHFLKDKCWKQYSYYSHYHAIVRSCDKYATHWCHKGWQDNVPTHPTVKSAKRLKTVPQATQSLKRTPLARRESPEMIKLAHFFTIISSVGVGTQTEISAIMVRLKIALGATIETICSDFNCDKISKKWMVLIAITQGVQQMRKLSQY